MRPHDMGNVAHCPITKVGLSSFLTPGSDFSKQENYSPFLGGFETYQPLSKSYQAPQGQDPHFGEVLNFLSRFSKLKLFGGAGVYILHCIAVPGASSMRI